MSEDTISRETIAVRRELTQGEVEQHEAKAKATFEKQKQVESRLRALKDFVVPRTKKTLDPTYTKAPEGLEEVSFEEARALSDALEKERKINSARVGLLKAERRFHVDAAANGYVYDIHDCRLELDAAGTTVRYISEPSGEVVRERRATDTERQMSLPADEVPSANKAAAPAMVQ